MIRALLSLVLALAGLAGAHAADGPQKPLGDVPVMHEEAEAAGIHSVYDGPWEFFVGGGGAAFDCDGSGFPSVFLAGGKNPAKLYVNRSTAGGPLRFEEKPLDPGPIRNCFRM
jgi:enediyne biosynthesis protein E4